MMIDKLSLRETQVLLELLKNAKIADQEIARRIGTSRPTVIKVRKRLEKTGVITGYGVNVNYDLAGLHVLATSFVRWDNFAKKIEMQRYINYVKRHPCVIRFSSGEGVGSMTMMVESAHATLGDYELFWHDLQEKGGENVSEVQIFLSTVAGTYKQFDLAGPVTHVLSKKR